MLSPPTLTSQRGNLAIRKTKLKGRGKYRQQHHHNGQRQWWTPRIAPVPVEFHSRLIIGTLESAKFTQEPGWNYQNHHPGEVLRRGLVYKILRSYAQSGRAKHLGTFGTFKILPSLARWKLGPSLSRLGIRNAGTSMHIRKSYW